MPKANLLLIDDEAALLRLMQTYLTRLGYAVEACAEAARGLEIMGSAEHRIELAVVDLSLLETPNSLVDLANANPSAKLLVCSGSLFEVGSLPDDVRPRFGFLQKPFLPKMLADAVDDLLQGRAA